MTSHPIYHARTPQEFLQLSEEHGSLQLIAQLKESDVNKPASRWTFRHLLAYRLLGHPDTPFLGILAAEHQGYPLCHPEGDRATEVDSFWVQALTETPSSLTHHSDSELLRLPGGFFWTALARASRADDPPEARDYPQRERRAPERGDYTDSTDAIDGSASSSETSVSEYEPDNDDDDEDDYNSWRNKPEDVTVHLLICFLQFGLNLCYSPDPALGGEP